MTKKFFTWTGADWRQGGRVRLVKFAPSNTLNQMQRWIFQEINVKAQQCQHKSCQSAVYIIHYKRSKKHQNIMLLMSTIKLQFSINQFWKIFRFLLTNVFEITAYIITIYYSVYSPHSRPLKLYWELVGSKKCRLDQIARSDIRYLCQI